MLPPLRWCPGQTAPPPPLYAPALPSAHCITSCGSLGLRVNLLFPSTHTNKTEPVQPPEISAHLAEVCLGVHGHKSLSLLGWLDCLLLSEKRASLFTLGDDQDGKRQGSFFVEIIHSATLIIRDSWKAQTVTSKSLVRFLLLLRLTQTSAPIYLKEKKINNMSCTWQAML